MCCYNRGFQKLGELLGSKQVSNKFSKNPLKSESSDDQEVDSEEESKHDTRALKKKVTIARKKKPANTEIPQIKLLQLQEKEKYNIKKKQYMKKSSTLYHLKPNPNIKISIRNLTNKR